MGLTGNESQTGRGGPHHPSIFQPAVPHTEHRLHHELKLEYNQVTEGGDASEITANINWITNTILTCNKPEPLPH